jgi:hypothetical protein
MYSNVWSSACLHTNCQWTPTLTLDFKSVGTIMSNTYLYLWYLFSQTSCRITAYKAWMHAQSQHGIPLTKGNATKRSWHATGLSYGGPSNGGLRDVNMCLAAVTSSNLVYEDCCHRLPSLRGLFYNKSAALFIGQVKDHCPHFRDYESE